MEKRSLEDQDPVLQSLISKIFLHSPDHKTSKTTVYKILFELKNLLPDDNSIKEKIPFYWYYYGPNSDYIKLQIEYMEKGGKLKRELLPDGRPLYYLSKSINVDRNNDFSEAISKLEEFLKGFDFSKTKDHRREIYLKYAPFEFSKLFKIYYKERLEAFNSKICLKLLYNDNDYNEQIEKEFKLIELLLYKCEIEIPKHEIFYDYEDIFSSYVTSTIRLLEENQNTKDFGEYSVNKNYLDQVYDQSWNTFAMGQRIPEEGHDSFYDCKIDEWMGIYFNFFEEYNNTINIYYDAASSNLIKKEDKLSNLNIRQKNVLSSVINGYLNGGC